MNSSPTIQPGTVYLVGAGPGDPGLITVKGREFLASADIVVYDRLVNRRLLRQAPDDAELIDVGKVPGGGPYAQADINALLVDRAKEGKRVVRLKGGDPFVFGRGGEEALALAEAGVPFQVVPGVTSAVAAPAYAGIPLTHRGVASSVTIATGSEAPDKLDRSVAWDVLAKAGGTLVVLMGWENLETIVAELVREGRPAETPVALVESGSEPSQRTVEGTLADIVDRARGAGIGPPIVAVIGDVVALRGRLRWFDNRPLFGKRVLVTRTRAQAGAFSDMLLKEGAQPLEVPAITIEPPEDYGELDAALASLARYDWIVFASSNAVHSVFDRLSKLGKDARAFRSARVAAVGSESAASLREHGIAADFVPDEFVSEAVVAGLKRWRIGGARVLFPRSQIGRETIREGLAALGATVNEVIAYKTVTGTHSAGRVAELLAEGMDVATFTSSSTVRNLAALLDSNLSQLQQVKIACIGPITAAAAADQGLKVDIMAKEYTISGLVEALKAHYAEEASQDG